MERSRWAKMSPFDERKARSSVMLRDESHLVPVVCERAGRWWSPQSGPPEEKCLHKVYKTFKVEEFIEVIRRKHKLDPTQHMFFLANNKQVRKTQDIGDLYEKEASEDGFLYFSYTTEAAFGQS